MVPTILKMTTIYATLLYGSDAITDRTRPAGSFLQGRLGLDLRLSQ